MNVISGIYKGKKLDGFNLKGTRPTMSRIKESLFASLGNLENKRVLDLFAGSGALGIEALSMGALGCTFIDNSKEAIKVINKNITGIDGANVYFTDALKYLENTNDTFDLILLDPPYDDFLIGKALKIIEDKKLLNKNGLVVCEYEKENFESSFDLYKEKKYGDKHIKIYKNN